MNKLKSTSTLLLLTLIFSLLIPANGVHAQSASCRDVIVQPGDSLSGIAARLLGSVSAYNQIVSATNQAAAKDSSYTRIDNANVISAGWKLCVPTTGAIPSANNVTQPAVVPTPTQQATEEPQTLESEYGARWNGTGPFPLTIEYLRQQQYPGSDITFEQTLAPGVNYARYLVSYRSEGLKIYALMTVPNGTKPATGWPAIIFNHGYIPPEIYRTTERYVAYVDGFARNGYIVFRPDYRGHGFSEGEAEGAYGSPDYTIDVLNALASVKNYADTDPARIGMWGHSMGGYITLRAMVVSKDIKAGVIWAGVVANYSDMMSRWNRPTPPTVPQRARRWRQLLIDNFGTPEANPDFWDSLAANSYLTDLSGPLQLHHGTSDEEVPPLFSELLDEEVKAVGGSVEYFTYPGDNHNLSSNLYTALQRSVAFFDQNVKNK
ncbi:MAG: alpha/beta fold hydrolase [Caldilineaceae bacterium]